MYNMFTGLLNDITKSQPTKTTTTAKPPMSSIPPPKSESQSSGSSDGLGFGHVQGVYDPASDVGFYGNSDHFSISYPQQNNTYDPYAALEQMQKEQNQYTPEYTPANIEAATPFLDSYMRAKEAADKPGPVTSMFRDELS